MHICSIYICILIQIGITSYLWKGNRVLYCTTSMCSKRSISV